MPYNVSWFFGCFLRSHLAEIADLRESRERPPAAAGADSFVRLASYGYRHFLQALLIRRLLADGIPVRRMPEMVSGSSDELKRLILGGVEMVLRPEGGGEAAPRPNLYQQTLRACADKSVSGWLRVALGEGIELHLSDKRPKITTEERRKMLKRIEELLRQVCG